LLKTEVRAVIKKGKLTNM